MSTDDAKPDAQAEADVAAMEINRLRGLIDQANYRIQALASQRNSALDREAKLIADLSHLRDELRAAQENQRRKAMEAAEIDRPKPPENLPANPYQAQESGALNGAASECRAN